MTDRIDEIRVRCEVATAGPWKDCRRLDGVPTVANKNIRICDAYKNNKQQWADAEFIAHAREDIPYLLYRLAEAERQRDTAVKDMTDMANEIESTETCEWCKWYGDDGCQRPGEETRDCFEWRDIDI